MLLFRKRDEIYLRNLVQVNKIVEKVLFATILLPCAMQLCCILGVFDFEFKYIRSLFITSVCLTFIPLVLNRIDNEQVARMVVYYNMAAFSIFISMLGSTGKISIYIAYGIVPFLSCMYYSVKVMNISSLIGYITMVASLHYRCHYETWISPYTNTLWSAHEWFMSNWSCLTIEYILAYIFALLISKKLKSNYEKLLEAKLDKEALLDDLRDKSKKVFDANDSLVRHSYKLFEIQDKIIQFIGEVLGSHDIFTCNHIMHTKEYVGFIARDLRANGYYTSELSDDDIRILEMASCLHDIGKIHIPEEILNSTERFTVKEFELMKTHTTEGKKLLEFLPKIENGHFNEVAKDMAYYHHERWDGTGYPTNKAGTEIPLAARIMAAADVLDALISQRLYKNPMSVDDALKIFKETSGSQFEPCIAESVVRCRIQIIEADQKFKISEMAKNAEELAWWTNYHDRLKKIGLK